jgi:hypothetical protein
MRRPLALVVALVVALFGGAVLGEYDLTGLTPLVAGVLFGAVVAEVVLAVARTGDRVLAGASAVLTGAGLVLAIWVSSDHWRFIHPWSWAAVVVGPAATWLWLLKGSGRRADGNPTGP